MLWKFVNAIQIAKIIMCINTSNKVFHMIVSFEPTHYFRLLTKNIIYAT
jgi:hypothetical protein